MLFRSLRDESKIGLHAAITPTWSETAWYADYVLPTGMAAERHDLMSQETHSGQWISFSSMVDDPEYLNQPYVVTYQFKKLPDGSKWKPEPCSAK